MCHTVLVLTVMGKKKSIVKNSFVEKLGKIIFNSMVSSAGQVYMPFKKINTTKKRIFTNH